MAKAQNVEVMQANVEANGTTFQLADFREMVRAFDEQSLGGRLPVKLGHTTDDTQPAQGWISAMRVTGDKLLADIDEIPDELVEEIKQGRWRYVSMELLRNAERGGKKYKWMPDGLALLGAARPAFDALAGLADVFTAGLRGLTYESRFAFSRESGSETDRLRGENVRLQQQLVHAQFETAIQSGRILPRDREAFKRRYAESGTVDDATSWIASSPTPAGFNASPTTVNQQRQRQTFARADEELIHRTNERIEFERKERGRTVSYYEASLMVLREDKELAQRYIDMPSDLARR